MKPKKLKFGRAVRVYWHDSQSQTGWQCNTVRAGQTAKIASLGYVYTCSSEALVLTESIASNGHALSPVSIPWGSIEHIDYLGKDWDRL